MMVVKSLMRVVRTPTAVAVVLSASSLGLMEEETDVVGSSRDVVSSIAVAVVTASEFDTSFVVLADSETLGVVASELRVSGVVVSMAADLPVAPSVEDVVLGTELPAAKMLSVVP